MSQDEILESLLQFRNVATGTNKTLDEIINHDSFDPDISLIYNSELGGKIAYGGEKIPITKYYTLGEILETRASRCIG